VTRLVPCFLLKSVLTAEQWAAVKPYARATFDRTWASLGNSNQGHHAYRALRVAACHPQHPLGGWSYVQEGRAVERALYARAVALGVKPVMARGRQ
jgi:hypothetical protein